MWTLILSVVLKVIDMVLGKVQTDQAAKKAYVEFLQSIAPEFAKSAKTYLAYQGMQSDLDRQKAEIKKNEGVKP
jgi:hypothetical protein